MHRIASISHGLDVTQGLDNEQPGCSLAYRQVMQPSIIEDN